MRYPARRYHSRTSTNVDLLWNSEFLGPSAAGSVVMVRSEVMV